MKEALYNGFQSCERDFLKNHALNMNENVKDRSGSCAIIILIVGIYNIINNLKDNQCYVANLGDSRAIMSADNGKNLIELSTDHKPNEEIEKRRKMRK